MASTSGLSRTHLIYLIVLPLAILVGFLLADPMDTGYQAALVLILCVLSAPILMRWHHPVLVFSCNALICFAFIPGTPSMWMLMTVISLFFLVLNRCLGQPIPFFQAREVSYSLICLTAVVVATAVMSGGTGFRVLGDSSFGGRKYLTLLLGIALYFAISSVNVRKERAGLYMALFCLSSLTAMTGYMAVIAGPAFYDAFLKFFPIQTTIERTLMAGGLDNDVVRFGEAGAVAVAIYGFVASRYGVENLLDPRRPIRLALLGLSICAVTLSGFRSSVIALVLTFAVQFWLEGLHRKPLFWKLCLVGILALMVAVPNVHRLPGTVQRSLAFLPLDVDPMVRQSAEASTQWRLDMWQELLPQLPRHLIKGKGYGMDADELYMASVNSFLGYDITSAGSAVSGDYHSGPISVILPFGIPGVLAFGWFLVASVKALRQNFLYGDPTLKYANTFLLSIFIVRIITFLFVFGSLYSDLINFSAIIAVSVSINHGVRTAPDKAQVQGEEEEEFLSTGSVATGF